MDSPRTGTAQPDPGPSQPAGPAGNGPAANGTGLPAAAPEPGGSRPPAAAPEAPGNGGKPAAIAPDYSGKNAFIDRELSWLEFNQRVLEEAQDPANPLLERIKFLAIVAGNLDEFFEVRVARLLQMVESGVPIDGIAALDTAAKLDAILKACQKSVKLQYKCWNEDLLPRLREHNVHVKTMASLGKDEEKQVHAYFRKEIYPLLTPIKVDPAHPFPWVLNKALCLLALLKEDKRREVLGVVTIPRSLPRLISVPIKEKGWSFLFIHDVVQQYLPELFKGYAIRASTPFRCTRNSNLYAQDEEAGSLIDAIEAVVHNRRRGDVVRLEIDKNASKRMVDTLARIFDVDAGQIFKVDGPVNLNRLASLYHMVPLAHLKYPPLHPSHAAHLAEPEDIFHEIRHRDILLHHPFDSYDPVVRFIQAAAEDPRVAVIKQTLYRTNQDSPIMYALLEAAEQGKEVVAVVELKARFDEKSNIQWARQLEEKGGTVVYGLVGLKTHCKLALAIRKEDSGFASYAHVGTGNYNPETARVYTDLSLLTSDPGITEGVSEVFNFLTSHSRPEFQGLQVGPVNFLSETLRRIRAEAEAARAGRPAAITAKMNSLMDKEVIEALYDASRAGAAIRLIVRGTCALRPGVKGLSDNIQVKSVVGRFLEHSRIFHFLNDAGNAPAVFIGSGDWMERNLRERVEVAIPIKDPAMARQIEDILAWYWADTAKSRWMRGDGTYVRVAPPGGETPFNAQEWLARRAESPDLPPPAVPRLFPDRLPPGERPSDSEAA
jgi:polyphosphate kinase